VNIAIPKQNLAIAPCFNAAKQFEIVVIKNKRILSSKSVECYGSEGFQRVRLLRLHEIHTLICNGIKNFYRDQLLSIGINVIPHVNDSIESALTRFLSGELDSYDSTQDEAKSNNLVSHDELANWAKKLFEDNGYSVSLCIEHDSSLVDLVAEMQCPICRKKIDVAICCGAQIYRVDQEIKEFHHIAKTRYNARVYVYLTDPKIAKSCDDYGINFISPEMNHLNNREENNLLIPILQKPIEGHEKAFNYK
jgi:predicted Fe-Mo cluster-binding NifX family protein